MDTVGHRNTENRMISTMPTKWFIKQLERCGVKKIPDVGPLKKVEKKTPEMGPVGAEDELDSKSRLALNLI